MATVDSTKSTPTNVKILVGPDGKEYQFPKNWTFFNLAAPPGWSVKGEAYIPGNITAPPLATLYGPGGAPLVVAVGSTYSHDMIQKGYSLEPGGYQDSTLVAKKAQNQPEAPTVEPPTAWKTDGGDFALIRFTDDPTPNDNIDDTGKVWILDMQKGVYRPVADPAALRSLAAMAGVPSLPITDVPSSVLHDPTQPMFDGEFLSMDYAVVAGKELVPYPEKYSTRPDRSTESPVNQFAGTVYGKQRYNIDSETSAATSLLAFFDWLANGDPQNQYINKETLDKYVYDPNSPFLKEAYSAVLYGDYSLTDIWKELKAKELADAGDAGMANFKAFSRSMNKNQWVKTAEGANAEKAGPAPTGSLLLKLGEVRTTGLVNMPAGFFSRTAKTLDPNKPEDLETIRKVEASYYDVLNRMATANTEEAYGVALADWDNLRETLRRNLNIQLSADVNKAWNEIAALSKTESAAGLEGTGIHQEIVDRYLADRRKNDQIAREKELTEEEKQQLAFVHSSGSAKDVKALVDKWDAEDKARGLSGDNLRSVKYGLVPSEASKGTFSIENFRKLYPYFTDEQLKKALSAYVDENGNYRSTIFYKLYHDEVIKNESDRFAYQMSTAQKAIDAQMQKEAQAYATGEQAQLERMGVEGAMDQITGTGETGMAGEPTGPTGPTGSTGPVETPAPADQAKTSETATPPPGATPIYDPSGLAGLSESQIWRDPNSNKIYKLPETSASTGPTGSTGATGSTDTSGLLPPQTPTPTELLRQITIHKGYDQMTVTQGDFNNYWKGLGWTTGSAPARPITPPSTMTSGSSGSGSSTPPPTPPPTPPATPTPSSSGSSSSGSGVKANPSLPSGWGSDSSGKIYAPGTW